MFVVYFREKAYNWFAKDLSEGRVVILQEARLIEYPLRLRRRVARQGVLEMLLDPTNSCVDWYVIEDMSANFLSIGHDLKLHFGNEFGDDFFRHCRGLSSVR